MMYTFLAIFLSILIAILCFIAFIYAMDPIVASTTYRGKKSDHFTGKHFYNIGWTPEESRRLEGKGKDKLGFKSFVKWLFDKNKKLWEERVVPTIVPEAQYNGDDFLITYVNHATILIQTQGLNILTDPVWSYRVSPSSWIGPRRYVNTGIKFEDLPKIDFVLLSHNHYDHMDIVTLKKLYKRFKMPIYTGLGNKKYLKKRRIKNTVDMDWGDSQTFTRTDDSMTGANGESTASSKNATITFLPAQHFSARGVTDRNKTLWGGFGLTVGEKTLYFAGDTGYGDFIADIRKLFPDGFDVGLLPIGAYVPRWFMGSIHTNPLEGLQIQSDLNIRTGIGIHWGTFSLALDGQDEPLDDLKKAHKKPGYSHLDFRVGPNGTQWKI